MNNEKLVAGYSSDSCYIAITCTQLHRTIPIANLDLSEIDLDKLYNAVETTELLNISSTMSIITKEVYDYLVQLLEISDFNTNIQDYPFNMLISNVLYTKKDLIIHLIKRDGISQENFKEIDIKRRLLYLFDDLIAWLHCIDLPQPGHL